MTTIQTILLFALLVIWLCFSVVFLITAVQSFIYDRKRCKLNSSADGSLAPLETSR